MSNERNRLWAELGIWAAGYLAENKIEELKEKGKKGVMVDIAHAFSKDVQENPDKYYDFGEELYNRYKKRKKGR